MIGTLPMRNRSSRLNVIFGIATVVLCAVPSVIAGGGKPPKPLHVAAQSHQVAQQQNAQHAMYQQAMHQQSMQRQAIARQTAAYQRANRQNMTKNQVLPGQQSQQVRNRQAQSRNRAYAYRPGVRQNRGNNYSNRYSTSNKNIRAVVSRLRSTHSSLARLDHDYKGHRVRALHAISKAVRQLSHSSMGSQGRNSRRGMGVGNQLASSGNRTASGGNRIANGGNRTANGGNSRNQPMTQAKSDAQMRKSFETLRSVNVQLTSQGSTQSHSSAQASVRRAMRELGIALTIR